MKRPLAVLLAAQILLGVIYSFATPVFEASDEIWHYPVVRQIAENRRLPVQDPAVQQPWEQEGSQPPLYYAAGAALTGWIDAADYPQTAHLNPFVKAGVPGTTDNVNLVAHRPGQSPLRGGSVLAVYLIRWLSILLGTATAYLAWRLASTAVPGQPAVALLTAALVAFTPMVLFINASVNNDTLLMLLATLALWLLARDVESNEPGMRWRATLLLGVVLGAASLTKVSGLVLLPIAALGLTLEAVRSRNWRIWLARGLVLLAVVLLIGGWWYARNLVLYGEPTGMTRMAEVAGTRPAGFDISGLAAEWKSFWYSFWGLFGAFNILAPPWFYTLTGALSLLAAGGLVVALARMIRRGAMPTRWRSHVLLLSFIGLTAIGLARWTLMTYASQGRLMFSAIAPIALYLAIGLLAWFPRRWHRWLSGGLSGALAVAAAIVAVTAIAPAYRPDPPIAELPAEAIPLNITCDDGLVLAGYQLNQDTTLAGQPLDVTLYWRSSQPLADDLQLSVNAYAYQGENVAKLDSWPGRGLRPTSFWQPDQLYADRWLIASQPDSNTPTTMKLGISWNTDLLNPASSRLVACHAEGDSSGAIFVDGGALVGPLLATPATAPISTVQHGIQLLDNSTAVEGNQVHANLTWLGSEPIPADYTVFVHLFDAAGNKVAQGDAPPRDGFWPTSRWRPGEPVTSTHTLDLPPDLPPGQYILGAGMYDPATGERLFAYDATGAEWRDWMIVLAKLNLP